MSFEDSMLEEGFHNEEEYLEYLMDEADKEWERQQYERTSYQEEYYEDDDYCYEDDEEYYDKLRERYRQWIKEENPLKFKIFTAWVKFDAEWESRYKEPNIFLDKFGSFYKSHYLNQYLCLIPNSLNL